MRRVGIRLVVLATMVALVAPAVPATAGSGGRWERFTATNLASTDAPVLHRTGDGRLHIIWPQRPSGGQRLLHQVVAPGGALGASSSIVTGWAGVSNPDVVADGSGMRVFFGGQRTTSSGDPYQHMATATAPQAGSPWTLGPNLVAEDDFVYGSEIGAALAADGTPLQTWAATTGVFVHRGLEPSQNRVFQPGCCSYNADLAVEGSSSRMWVAWYTRSDTRLGVYVQEVNTATGAPQGGATRMPGSVTAYQGRTESIHMSGRTPITGRRDRAGVFVAYPAGYPSLNRIRVWRIGASGSTTVAAAENVNDATLAADPQGRLWVLWSRRLSNGTVRIYARRSNPTVSTWGRTISVTAPRGTVDTYKLAADAQSRRVDVVGLFGKVGETASWHTQLEPALTLRADPQRFSGRRTVTFTVRDAGVPVPNARVTVAGESGRTNSNGVVRIAVGPYRSTTRVPAVATKSGYVRHRIVLRVSPP